MEIIRDYTAELIEQRNYSIINLVNRCIEKKIITEISGNLLLKDI